MVETYLNIFEEVVTFAFLLLQMTWGASLTQSEDHQHHSMFSHKLLRSAVGMTHVLQSRHVMDYTTSYFPLMVLGYHSGSPQSLDYTQKLTRSTLALKLSVSPPYYPWVTATQTMSPNTLLTQCGSITFYVEHFLGTISLT